MRSRLASGINGMLTEQPLREHTLGNINTIYFYWDQFAHVFPTAVKAKTL
ncbi:MAG: hypothetical protein F6K56_08670 [Moorea sp. SIO3G5]|nr:hypothetical protein [Moorena sp. SIO3G5]